MPVSQINIFRYNDMEEERAAQSRAFKESTRAMLAENQLPPAQKAAAIRARQVYSLLHIGKCLKY